MVTIFRWVLMLPGALVAASLTRLLLGYFNEYAIFEAIPYFLYDYIGPHSLPGRLIISFFSDMPLGVVFVMTASAIAPARKSAALLGAAVFIGLLAVLRGLTLLSMSDYVGAFSCASTLLGAIVAGSIKPKERDES